MLSRNSFAPWVPVADMKTKVPKDSHAWIVGLSQSTAIYVVCKGAARFSSSCLIAAESLC